MIGVSIYSIYMNQIEINEYISICGWVKSKRSSKIGISFLDIYDGSIVNTIQVIVSKNLYNYKSEVIKLTSGCSVIVQGILKSSLGKLQMYEIYAKSVFILGKVKNPDTYPISAKKHTLEYLRNFYHLRSRTNLIGVIARIRNILYQSLHEFLFKNSYFWISTPIITSINAEGAGSMFYVSMLDIMNVKDNMSFYSKKKENFFNKEVFLTVSGQLTLEAYACSLSKVYSFGPIFRAENSNTKRHLSEFWMLEVEKSFSSLYEIATLSEKILKYSISKVLDVCMSDLLYLQSINDPNLIQKLNDFIEIDFIMIDYKEAIRILSDHKKYFQDTICFGEDLSTNHEKYLVEKYFQAPVIIKNYPKSIKAFYMRLNDDKNTVSAIDILIPIVGEIIGGSEREERFKILKKRMKEKKLVIKNYNWYQDLRKYGTVPHAGFGLGFERLVMFVTGSQNVKEVIPFPRTVGHAEF